MAEIGQMVVKDAVEIRSDILRTIRNGMIEADIPAEEAQVGPNTDFYIYATALSNELAVVNASVVVKADQQMPDTATGTDLGRIAAFLKREKQPAAGSVGNVLLTASATCPIETGRELTDVAGLRYEVVIGGDYEDGQSVPIRAIDVGGATNLEEGDVLRWVSAPPFSADAVEVDEGGLVNGIDEEDDEILRSRVLAIFQNPPGAGDWQHAAELTEASSPSVQKAFIYPAIEGGATMHAAAAAAPTATNKSRVVAASIMAGLVEPYLKGKMPTHAHVVVTTVQDVNADVAIGLSIPEAATASPPGPGGGWTNGTPWPAPNGVTTFRNSVTAVTSSTVFTVDADTAPTRGVTRVSWFSPFEWKLYSALVSDYSGSAGAYTITVDTAFVDIAVGCYIFPESENAPVYLAAILAQFALMGPGEKSSNVSALVRGFRHPTPANSYPYQLGPALLRAVTDAADEVLGAQFFHRTDGATTKEGSGGILTPEVPVSVSDAPKIYVPRHIALYRVP